MRNLPKVKENTLILLKLLSKKLNKSLFFRRVKQKMYTLRCCYENYIYPRITNTTFLTIVALSFLITISWLTTCEPLCEERFILTVAILAWFSYNLWKSGR